MLSNKSFELGNKIGNRNIVRNESDNRGVRSFSKRMTSLLYYLIHLWDFFLLDASKDYRS